MVLRLIYVMDPFCSWCWGFTPVLEGLMTRTKPQNIPFEIVTAGVRTPNATGNTQGLLGKVAYENEPACRAVVTARSLSTDTDLVWSFVKTLQQAFHCKGIDINQEKALLKIAEKTGFNPDEFVSAFQSPALQGETLADFQWVESLGIAGFPALLAERDGQMSLLTSGYQSLEQVRSTLEHWLAG